MNDECQRNPEGALAIEHPIPWASYSVSMDDRDACYDMEVVGRMMEKWSYMPTRKLWAFGYKLEYVATFFESIPTQVDTLLADYLRELQIMLAKGELPHTLPDISLPSRASADDSGRSAETSMWQEQCSLGYLSVSSDGLTQRRTGVSVNARLSAMWGMHAEELIARFANHDLHLHCPALDLIFLMMDELVFFQQDRVRYYRMFGSLTGRNRGMILVCSDVRKVFDSAGKHTQVCLF
jgi:hypothetical protein